MKHNFGAGPGILPHEVLKQAAAAVVDLNGTGLSILEISHRSAEFEAVLDEAVKLVKELFSVPEGYSVLFLQGGASMQFALAPYNLLPDGGKAAYLETGVWANKALKEAKYFGETVVVATSKESNFTYIPKDFEIPQMPRIFTLLQTIPFTVHNHKRSLNRRYRWFAICRQIFLAVKLT